MSERKRTRVLHFDTGLIAVVAMLLSLGCRRDEQPRSPAVTLATRLIALTNASSFATAPVGRAGMLSSYDRSGGNSDWMTVRPLEVGGTAELADLRGPGCLSRIWFTSLRADEWMFFFDGEETPRLQCTTKELLGESEVFKSPIAGMSSCGSYSYLPLPYEKSLRVVIKTTPFAPDHRRYFHINYETFPETQPVQSFPGDLDAASLKLIKEVASAWQVDDSVARMSGRPSQGKHPLGPGQQVTWCEQRGEGVVTAFGFRLRYADGVPMLDRSRSLREMVLRCYWDGESQPSVEVPFGDFFGNAYYRREYSSLPLAHTNGTFFCRFPMPFRKGARATLTNEGDTPVEVEWLVDVSATRFSGDSRYFHAAWSSTTRNGQPFTFLETEGRGHYVGCYLNAMSTDGSWFILEGDESFRVDGENVPCWHGTGLEDYFNGAWYYTGLSDLPLHGLMEKAPIRTGQYRFHVGDAIAFDRQIRAQFEFGAGNRSKGYMSASAYWYQDRPAGTPTPLPDASKRHPPADPLLVAGIMGRVFEVERLEHWNEARERCLVAAELLGQPQPAVASMLRLRSLGYEHLDAETDDVVSRYQSFAGETEERPIADQARLLAWYHSDSTNALLGSFANASYRLYLDGELVAEGQNPALLAVRPVTLAPGLHELAAEVTPIRGDAWFSACLRTHKEDIGRDGSWEVSPSRPDGWPRTTDGVDWKAFRKPGFGEILPRLAAWQFVPNAFVNMQSGYQLMRGPSGWDKPPNPSKAYFRKRFVIPDLTTTPGAK